MKIKAGQKPFRLTIGGRVIDIIARDDAGLTAREWAERYAAGLAKGAPVTVEESARWKNRRHA